MRKAAGKYRLLFHCLFVKAWIDIIDIFLIQFFFGKAQAFAETLEVDNLASTQEFDDIVYIGVIGKTQDVVIGDAGFLLCCQIFGKIGNQIALDCHGGGAPWESGGGGGINTGSMIHEVGIKPGRFDLILCQITGQLMNDGADHFQMPEFFCA